MLKEAAQTFLELLRETADQHEAAWLAPSEGDVVRYCFRYYGEGAMGIVWREGEAANDNEYVLLATWSDGAVEHRAAWVIWGDWEIRDLFGMTQRLERGICSQERPPGLRIRGRFFGSLVMFVSALQAEAWGLRFESDQFVVCVLDGEEHFGALRMPRDCFFALLELLKDRPVFDEEDAASSSPVLYFHGGRGGWIEHEDQWTCEIGPVEDALQDWLRIIGKAQPSSMELFRRRQLKQLNRASVSSFRSW